MKKNKVHAIENAVNPSAKSRLKNIGKWIVALCGLPMTYVVLPVSCCVRNPATMVLYDDNTKERLEPIRENLAVGIFGMMGCICCCGCCLGECGSYEPKEF
jgi:hypothetical protein